MSLEEFETVISASQQQQTHSLDHATTAIGLSGICKQKTQFGTQLYGAVR